MGLGSLDYPRTPLVRQQVFISISHGGINFISIQLIASTTCLGSWTFITPIIVARFLLDHRLFLLEAIGANNYYPFPFQAHMRLVHELFLLDVVKCVPCFMQFVKRGSYWLQETISHRLHNHFFSHIISNMVSNLHCTRLKSCVGPRQVFDFLLA